MSIESTAEACRGQLKQLAELLQQLPTGSYAHCDAGVLGTSIGAHVRHILDHYDCLFNGLANRSIDYACRSRDNRAETDVRYTGARLATLLERLKSLSDGVNGAVDVQHEPGSVDAPANRSSVGRELEFLISHTAHHYALIAVLLTRFGIEIPKDFGLAPSTVRHRASLPGCGDVQRARH
ncbi:MAG: DinB family protein [Pseudomonadota bacterium]